MKKVALIVAGGRGERMNSKIPKQFLLLNNLPILMHTIKQFSHFEEIILVLPTGLQLTFALNDFIHGIGYFPMQKLAKISPSKSSLLN